MQISETTFKKLPEHLKPMFKKLPNRSSEAVLAGFLIARQKVDSPLHRTLQAGKCRAVASRLPPSAGWATPASAARFFYCAKASKADRGDGNNHPTVKPTDLMRYLCRLVTPPDGIVLDPFAGSGSTGRGAVLEGFQFIGIEREIQYVEIAWARVANAVCTKLANVCT